MARPSGDAGAQEMKLVLCRGVFDLFHVAHLRHLEEARSLGDLLVISLTPDATAEREKRKPIIPQEERKELLLALRCVAAVNITEKSIDDLKNLKPDIYCKGSDYLEKAHLPEEVEFCAENGIEIVLTKPNPQTTSGIISRIKSYG